MPPSAEAVVRGAPVALVALSVPILALAASSLKETLTDEETADRDEEAKRRAQLLSEMLDILKNQEKRAEDAKSAEGKIVEEEKEEEGQDDGNVVRETSGNPTDDEGDVDSDDEEGQLTFDDVHLRSDELAEIVPEAPELEQGIEACAKLLLKELKVAAKKTEAQDDIKYADGKKLEGLLECPQALDNLAKTAKRAVPTQVRADVQQALSKGRRVLRAQRRQDFAKAFKMIVLAKDALPWVLASSMSSVFSTSIRTVSLHYRAEALQTLQRSKTSQTSFKTATLAMLSVEIVAALAEALQSQLTARSEANMAKSIQLRLFHALSSKDMTWWSNQNEPWELIKKVWFLPQQVKSALETPRALLNQLVSLCIQVRLVWERSSRMLNAMLVLHWSRFFLRKGIGWIQTKLCAWATRNLVMPSEDKFTWIHSLNPEYIQMYQSFVRAPKEASDLKKFLDAHNRQTELTRAVLPVSTTLRSLLAQAGTIAEFSSMGSLVQEGSLELTQAETMMHYASQVNDAIEDTYQTLQGTERELKPLAEAYDIIAIPPKIELSEGFDPGGRAVGHFIFEKVRFSYPCRKAEILKGTSFEAKPGQVVGITGTTGCGKSTCLRLIERFYDVTGGRILLDGRDIREYQAQWLRAQIVAVAQEPKLLPMSIRENLTFGCSSPPSMEEIEQACRAANIWDVLSDPQKFPNGLETKMSVVQNVAGGEKQRICIARAILANPPILLLDEATSALDEVSQAQVQEALNKLMKGRTTLVVAHRLSTIKDSDKIVAMQDGQVVDDGTHQELLMKPDGVWRKLWLEQGSDDKASGAQEPPPPPPPPTLQRTTTSTSGKLMVLRQAVLALAGDELDRAKPVMAMIDELESQAVERFDVKMEMGFQAKDSKPVARPSSKWSRVRGLHRMGCLRSPSKGDAQLAEQPKHPREASMTRARSASITSIGSEK